MCGRYTLHKTPDQVREYIPFVGKPELIQARFNIAPAQQAVVVVSGGELKSMRWGLVPFWAQDEQIGHRMINARSETADSKPAFRKLLGRRRCLVLADGFYEWKKEGRGKVPYYFQMRDERPFAFAGLWDEWKKPQGDPLQTFTILTTDANACVAPIHPRMPVILLPKEAGGWMEPVEQAPAALAKWLRPLEAELLQAYAVRPWVNDPSREGPECIERAGPGLGLNKGKGPGEDTQPSLF